MGSVGNMSSNGTNSNDDIEYEKDFTDSGVRVHHTHYKDGRQEYDIYDADTGEYIDTAESTNELVQIVEDYNRRKK